jgi:hypothetical protein
MDHYNDPGRAFATLLNEQMAPGTSARFGACSRQTKLTGLARGTLGIGRLIIDDRDR